MAIVYTNYGVFTDDGDDDRPRQLYHPVDHDWQKPLDIYAEEAADKILDFLEKNEARLPVGAWHMIYNLVAAAIDDSWAED